MTWQRAKTPSKTVGPVDVYYISRKGQSEGGHDVVFPDGTAIRVLPDGTTGQRRSRTISWALTKAKYLLDGSPATWDEWVAFVVGHLAVRGLTWEILQPERSLEDVVEEAMAAAKDAAQAIARLDQSGWQIIRKGAS